MTRSFHPGTRVRAELAGKQRIGTVDSMKRGEWITVIFDDTPALRNFKTLFTPDQLEIVEEEPIPVQVKSLTRDGLLRYAEYLCAFLPYAQHLKGCSGDVGCTCGFNDASDRFDDFIIYRFNP